MSEADRDRPNVAIFPPFLFAGSLVLGLVAHALCPYRLDALWLRWAGGTVAIGALAVGLWGERTMKAAGTNVRPDRPSLVIVDGGPFAHSRNPLYLGVLGLFTGVGLALASPAFLAFVIPMALVLHYGVVSREEAYLEEKFGEAYRSYKTRVRRWI
jgi:protein-S-isoprenylcysteine O-methyltransferase Ste14